MASGADIGFPVSIDGSREKFYNTNETVFTGVSVNGTLDWEYIPVPGTDPDAARRPRVRVAELPREGLRVRRAAPHEPTVRSTSSAITMYEPAGPILDWIAAHPTATTDCGIVIQYSIYGNYADYIESNHYGVRVSLNASYGSAVVTDLTVFDPNVIPTLGN